MKRTLKGNLAMAVSKFFSGFNQNALKYLVPNWMSPLSGVALRLGFGTIAFWVIGRFTRKDAVKASVKQKLSLLALGFVLMFGYMFFLLAGLKYTTPVTSSIFISLQPAVVFVLCALFMHEKVTARKILGLIVGIGGALVCILTVKAAGVSTKPMLGCTFCALSTITYSAYLVISGIFIKQLDNITVSKWTFTGGAIASAVAVAIGGWYAPVLLHIGSIAFWALAFVLVFPTTISYFLMDIGLRNLSDTVVALYGNVILIVSTIASYILGQDKFSWWQMLAIVMMILSVYFVEVAERKNAPTPSTSAPTPESENKY